MLARWDAAVLANRQALLEVEAELMGVHAGQEALASQLEMVEMHQRVRIVLCLRQFFLGPAWHLVNCALLVCKEERSPRWFAHVQLTR